MPVSHGTKVLADLADKGHVRSTPGQSPPCRTVLFLPLTPPRGSRRGQAQVCAGESGWQEEASVCGGGLLSLCPPTPEILLFLRAYLTPTAMSGDT